MLSIGYVNGFLYPGLSGLPESVRSIDFGMPNYRFICTSTVSNNNNSTLYKLVIQPHIPIHAVSYEDFKKILDILVEKEIIKNTEQSSILTVYSNYLKEMPIMGQEHTCYLATTTYSKYYPDEILHLKAKQSQLEPTINNCNTSNVIYEQLCFHSEDLKSRYLKYTIIPRLQKTLKARNAPHSVRRQHLQSISNTNPFLTPGKYAVIDLILNDLSDPQRSELKQSLTLALKNSSPNPSLLPLFCLAAIWHVFGIRAPSNSFSTKKVTTQQHYLQIYIGDHDFSSSEGFGSPIGLFNSKNSIYLRTKDDSATHYNQLLYNTALLHELFHSFDNFFKSHMPSKDYLTHVSMLKTLAEQFLLELAYESDKEILALLNFSEYPRSEWYEEMFVRYWVMRYLFPEKKLLFSEKITEKLNAHFMELTKLASKYNSDFVNGHKDVISAFSQNTWLESGEFDFSPPDCDLINRARKERVSIRVLQVMDLIRANPNATYTVPILDLYARIMLRRDQSNKKVDSSFLSELKKLPPGHVSLIFFQALMIADFEICEAYIHDNGVINIHFLESLRYAIKLNNTRLKPLILDMFKSLSLGEQQYNSLLKAAVLSGNMEIAQHLLENRITPLSITSQAIVLLDAAISGHLAILNYAKEKNFDFNLKDAQQNTALHLAVKNNHIECVRFLLGLETVHVDAKNKYGETPYYLAYLEQNACLPLLMSDTKIDTAALTYLGTSVIQIAYFQNNNELIVKFLPEQIRFLSKYFNMELKVDLLKKMLPDIDKLSAAQILEWILLFNELDNKQKLVFLQKLVELKQVDLIEKILRGNYDVNTTNADKQNLLHILMKRRDSISWQRIYDLLWEKNISIDSQDIEGFTPLCFACFYPTQQKFEWLRLHGAKPNTIDVEGDYPIAIFLQQDSMNSKAKQQFYQYLTTDLELTRKNNDGLTILHLAIANKNLNFFRYLITERGMDINLTNNNGDTPLHYALKFFETHKDVEPLIEYILECKNISYSQNNDGCTPLHLAVELKYRGIKFAYTLLNNMTKEQVSLRDINGETAEDLDANGRCLGNAFKKKLTTEVPSLIIANRFNQDNQTDNEGERKSNDNNGTVENDSCKQIFSIKR